MKPQTQKLILQYLLSASDAFSRCIGIISPDYFDPDLRPAVKFIVDYYNTYSAVPPLDYINSEYDIELQPLKLGPVDVKFACDKIEAFCKRGALYKAILDSAEDVTSGDAENFGKVLERVQRALSISLETDLGTSMYDNVEARLLSYLDTEIYEPVGIRGIDIALGGGLARKQVTLFSANSGGGKSLMMSNIAANYSKRGLHVLQLSLELTEQMIDLRNVSILTGVKTTEWKTNIAEIAGTIGAHKAHGAGSFIVKRIAGGSTANDIRSYIKLYETEYGYAPDVLVVDYLDLMTPNGGVRNKGIFEQDKEKSEQLAEIAYNYNCIVITASQQNRDGVRTTAPDQAIIAGGISKINTVDNYISIYMNNNMRRNGELFLYYLKTRSSSAVGSMTQLAFNPDNLIIADDKAGTFSIMEQVRDRARGKSESIMFPGTITGAVPDEFVDIIARYHQDDNTMKYDDLMPQVINMADSDATPKASPKLKLKQTTNHDELLALMSSIQG